MFPNNFLLWRIVAIDENFRRLAFTEAEARDFVSQYAASEGKFEMTLKNKLAMFGDFLGLPEKVK
jgi:hypothetical protein